MKNLENYGVQELDAKEQISVDGGTWRDFLAWIGFGYTGVDIVGGVVDSVYGAYNAGYSDACQ